MGADVVEETSTWKRRVCYTFQVQDKNMSQNNRKPVGSPKVDEGFPLWRNQSASTRNRLLEFRAGKMFVRENMVHPDTRKGLVYIYQDDDGVMHFCWMDRSRGVVEEDLITMPADCTFKRVEKCTTGRVYLLKFKSNRRVVFHWMQEPSAANDLHICNRVNSLLNFPPPRVLFPEQIFTNELQFILNQLNSEQLHALYNGDDIVWVDARHQTAAVEDPSGQPQSSAAPPPPDPFVNLDGVVNEESVKTIMKNPSLMKRLESKLPPIDGDQTKNLEETVKSIPFEHAIEDFSMSLRQGTSGQILKDLNVNAAAVAAAEKGNVDSFIKALQGGASAVSQTPSESPHGPGNSGSPGRKPKDPSQGNSRRDSEGNRKESPTQEEQKSNFKHGESRKRNYETMSRGVILVHSGQQTEPIRITSIVQSLGEMKISKKFVQPKIQNSLDKECSLEKGQNTDPVQIEEYVSSARYNWNNEQGASGSYMTGGFVQRNAQQTKQVVSTVKLKGELESAAPSPPHPVVKVVNEREMITKESVESKVTTDPFTPFLAKTNETKLSNSKREGRGITLTNDYHREINATLRKRAYPEVDEMKEHGKDAGTKKFKFEDNYLETNPQDISGEIQNVGADGNVVKVDGEQQTEPVRITSIVQSLGEMKISKKFVQTKIQNSLDKERSLEKGQNTDPVQIEEYVSSAGYNWNNEHGASGSYMTGGFVQRNVQQTEQEVATVKLKGDIESAAPSPPHAVFKVVNEREMITKESVESKVTTDPFNATLRKRAYPEVDEMKEYGKHAGTKKIKFEGNHLETNPQDISGEIQNDGAHGNVVKVEGEQQTEPVRIKSAPSSGAETKITTKRATARAPRTDGSMERSQNTDPVLIEEKQKRQSKPNDPKPPGQE